VSVVPNAKPANLYATGYLDERKRIAVAVERYLTGGGPEPITLGTKNFST